MIFLKPVDGLGNNTRRVVCAQWRRKILPFKQTQSVVDLVWLEVNTRDLDGQGMYMNGRTLRLQSPLLRCRCRAKHVEDDSGLRLKGYVVTSESSSSSLKPIFSSIGDSENLFRSP